MKVEPGNTLAPAEMLAAAQAGYERQMQLLAICHGRRWPEFEDWISGYLQEQLRLRLIEIGWRPKR